MAAWAGCSQSWINSTSINRWEQKSGRGGGRGGGCDGIIWCISEMAVGIVLTAVAGLAFTFSLDLFPLSTLDNKILKIWNVGAGDGRISDHQMILGNLKTLPSNNRTASFVPPACHWTATSQPQNVPGWSLPSVKKLSGRCLIWSFS